MDAAKFYESPDPTLTAEQLRLFVKALQQFLRDKDDELREWQAKCKQSDKNLEKCQEQLILYQSALEGMGSRSSSGSSKIPNPEFIKWTGLDIQNSRSTGVFADLIIVYDSLEQRIRKFPRGYLSEHTLNQYYTKVELPSFHWWSDEISIYRQTHPEAKHSRIVARKHKKAGSNETLVSTQYLGQLGLDVKLQRIFGKITVLYMQSKELPSSTELRDLSTRTYTQ